jgi:hypothetical protein
MRQGGRGRAVPLPDMPYQHQAGRAARRNPDTPVPARQPYRARRAYQRHSRTPYAPGRRRRAVPRPGPPYRSDCLHRRVGTLPKPCLTDACTVHDGHTHTTPVPPTRRGERQAATQATPSSRRRRHAASQSPDGRAPPSQDQQRRTRRPRRHADHALPGRTTDAGPPTVR